MGQYIFNLKDKRCMREQIGGKASSLARMIAGGFPVPQGHVICADAFEGTSGNPYKMCDDAMQELTDLITQLSTQYTYAVRSSAINEDGDNASFAGAYETLTDVARDTIAEAVTRVVTSADAVRVANYASAMKQQKTGIAVVIQRFVKPELAGVLFTSDPLTASAARMKGNFVCGEGELLVSGNANAEEFTINTLKYRYEGSEKFGQYARELYRHASGILHMYQMPVDIEWAVSQNKLYILQARPITTLKRADLQNFCINGSLAGEYLLSRTNVGEIFTRPVSPITFSVLESICENLGIPCFIDNICGQPYANISVVCSVLRAFGFSEQKSYAMIADLAGTIPEGVSIPIFPYQKKVILRAARRMLLSGKRKKYFRMSKKEFTAHMDEIAVKMQEEIRQIHEPEELRNYWGQCEEYMTRALEAIITSIQVKGLLNTRNKLEKIAGAELANALCEGCTAEKVLESMKPLLCLEMVIRNEMTQEEYRNKYGHRSETEMELATPYPYEDPDFPKNRMEEHIRCGFNVTGMQQNHLKEFEAAREQFLSLFPGRKRWLDRLLDKYKDANCVREEIRSKGVRLFCLLREFLLKTGELTGLGDDIFMLYFEEVLQLISGNKDMLPYIESRRKNYEHYLTYPTFPNLIYGRFLPEEWMENPNRRLDFYTADGRQAESGDIKGYAGAAGVVTGRVRVIMSLADANQLEQDEILVTTATNIGWTIYFPRAKAIVTDIGAPLSHAAIVAREFGIPAVVGCQNATTLLHTGDYVCVDGAAGSVIIINEKSA